MPNLICGNTFNPQNDKIDIKLPISMIYTSQTVKHAPESIYLTSFNNRFNGSRSVAAIGHVIGAWMSKKLQTFAVINHFLAVGLLK